MTTDIRRSSMVETAIPPRYSRLPAMQTAYSAGVADYGTEAWRVNQYPDSALRAAYRAGWACARQAKGALTQAEKVEVA